MMDKKQRENKHKKRYVESFGTWFGVCLTFVIYVLALVIFILALLKKNAGTDDQIKTVEMMQPIDTEYDVKTNGFL